MGRYSWFGALSLSLLSPSKFIPDLLPHSKFQARSPWAEWEPRRGAQGGFVCRAAQGSQGEWPPWLEFGLELSPALSTSYRTPAGPSQLLARGRGRGLRAPRCGSGPRPSRAAKVRERARPNRSRGRREAWGKERRRRRRRGGREGAVAAAGGEEPPRAVAEGGGSSDGGGGGGGGGAPAGPESGAGTRAAVTPRLPGGRARPQRTKEHVGAEEGPSSGRHEAPGAAGPAPRPRPPGSRTDPLGQPAAVRPAGPGPPHGAARAPAGPHAAAAAAAVRAARAAGRRRRRRRRRGAAPRLQARRAAPRGRQDSGRRRGQGGVQQPGACAGPAP